MDFYEKIVNSSIRNKDNVNFDLISLTDTSFIEKTNLKFCKFILGLSRQSVNIAARAELAQYPLDVFIKAQSIKYYVRLASHTDNALLDDAFLLSKNLHEKGTYSWCSYINSICASNDININDLNCMNYIKDQISFNNIKQKLKLGYEKNFFDKLKATTETSKIFLYSKIKTEYTINNFIYQSNFESRQNICKMRISDHPLEIERGRYKKVKREDRICTHCNKNQIEDEFHFFFKCSKYNNIREEFSNQNIKIFDSETSESEKLVQILSNSDHLRYVAPFIKKSYILRKVEPGIA